MDSGQIRAFVTVATIGDFTRAAAALNISQPALTRRIQKLEVLLNVTLLDRSTRTVALSAVGRRFLPEACTLLRQLDHTLNQFISNSSATKSLVSVACVSSVATHFMPGQMKSFNKKNPDVKIRLLEDDSDLVIGHVLHGRVDFGITPRSEDFPKEIVFEDLWDDPYVVACPQDHPLSKLRAVTWHDLQAYRFIIHGRRTKHGLLFDIKRARSEGISPELPASWFYEVQKLSTSMELVKAGLGVAIIPKMLSRSTNIQALIVRPLIQPVLGRKLGLIRHRDRSFSIATKQFYRQFQSVSSEHI